MSESAENDYLFVFIAHLVPEISLLLFFIMTSAAILDLEVKMIPKYFKWCFIRFVMLQIVGNDTFFYCYSLSSSRDTNFRDFQNGVGGHFEKWAIKELSRHFWEKHGGHFFLK